MKKYVMDSYAMIAFFENEPGAEKVALILKSLLERKAKAYMSVAECFAAALSHRLKAVIVTGDPEFKILEKEGLIEINWLE